MPILLSPKQPQTQSSVKIFTENKKIKLYLAEYVEDFRLLMRGLAYGWQRPCWVREINEFNGSLEDRFIETAYKVLEQNFIICITDLDSNSITNLQERIITADYKEEHTRWIYRSSDEKYQGWFRISWSRKEDFYDQARKIKGSKYYKPSVVVPPGQFEMVLDFAETNDFRFSPKAKQIVEEMQQEQKIAIRVELQPKKQISQILVTQTGEIADEFRDDD